MLIEFHNQENPDRDRQYNAQHLFEVIIPSG